MQSKVNEKLQMIPFSYWYIFDHLFISLVRNLFYFVFFFLKKKINKINKEIKKEIPLNKIQTLHHKNILSQWMLNNSFVNPNFIEMNKFRKGF